MNVIKVPLGQAKQVLETLRESDEVSKDFLPIKQDNILIVPLENTTELLPYEESDLEFPKKAKKRNFAQEVKHMLTQNEQDHLKTAFDQVGTIAIIEIDPELESKQEQIAQLLLQTTPTVKTVVKKVGNHQGTFRTQLVEHLAGEQTKEAIHKENGIKLKLNVEQVYFSPRLATERKRIMQEVRPGENILVMFSGCAPYVCVLAKNTEAKHITGIEINPQGHKYGLQNLELNKINNADLINGDVRKIVPTLDQTYDRIVMPLPKTAEEFLDVALQVSKPGTIIHLYAFMQEENLEHYYQTIKNIINKPYKHLQTIKAGQQSPHTYRFCIDLQCE